MERSSSPHSRAIAAALARTVGLAGRLLIVCLVVAFADEVHSAHDQGTHDNCSSVSGDRIYLVSTRGIGAQCDCRRMAGGLRCQELVRDEHGHGCWREIPWSALCAEFAEPLPTVVYVHGNRIDAGVDKSHGLEIYRSLAARTSGESAMRYIIWSWPSSKAPGILNDYRVKAARTRQVGWQLAWAMDQLPPETPLTLVGHSYGARVVTGALHLLAGGQLGGLMLTERTQPERPPVRAALLAAAVDAAWIRPGGFHGRALEQVEQLLLVNNHLDPAMRFYHLAFEGRVRPLGYDGISLARLGYYADRVRSVDVTSAVGRRHALEDYLAHSRRIGEELERVVNLAGPEPAAGVLADRQ